MKEREPRSVCFFENEQKLSYNFIMDGVHVATLTSMVVLSNDWVL